MQHKYNEFALNQLQKYGWKPGDGVGRNNDGRAEPVKPSRKSNRTGLGFSRVGEFDVSVWDGLYMGVCDHPGATSSHSINDGKDPDKKKQRLKKRLYSKFTKTATLVEGVEQYEEKVDATPILEEEHTPKEAKKRKKKKRKKTYDSEIGLSDKELFDFCGKGTCHPAARFGMSLSGKLARVARQDKELLEKMSRKISVTDS